MSIADNLQLSHQLGAALRARLLVVEGKAGRKPTWHDFHQTGVLLSERAEALYQVWRSRSAHQQNELLEQAAAMFEQARDDVDEDMAFDTAEKNTNAHDAVICDQAIANARRARATYDNSFMVSAIGAFEGVEGDKGVLDFCKERATQDPSFNHTLGIAYALRFRLACGNAFGFPQLPEGPALVIYGRQASKYLGVQDSPDAQNAYRSLLMYRALYAHSLGVWRYAWLDARKAFSSAVKHKDARHALRALLIGLLGSTGNRVYYALELLRDRLGS